MRRGKRPTVSFDTHPSINSGETGSGKSENRRLAIKSLLELSVSNPGKKGSLPNFRLQSSSLRCSEMLEMLKPSSIPTHLASESTPSCSSQTVNDSAVSKHLTITLSGTVWLPCLRVSAIFTFSTTSSQGHHQKKGSTFTSSTNPPTGTLANVGQGLRDLGMTKMRGASIQNSPENDGVFQTTCCVDVLAHCCHPPPWQPRVHR